MKIEFTNVDIHLYKTCWSFIFYDVLHACIDGYTEIYWIAILEIKHSLHWNKHSTFSSHKILKFLDVRKLKKSLLSSDDELGNCITDTWYDTVLFWM